MSSDNFKDLKVSIDYNSGILENLLHTLQNVQSTTMKLDKRMGHLESELQKLQSKSEFNEQNTDVNIEVNQLKDKDMTSFKKILSEVIDDKLSSVENVIADKLKNNSSLIKEEICSSVKENFVETNDLIKIEISDQSQENDNLHNETGTKVEKLISSAKDTKKSLKNLKTSIDSIQQLETDLAEKMSRLTRCTVFTNLRLLQEMTAVDVALDKSTSEIDASVKLETQKLVDCQENAKTDISDQLATLRDIALNELQQIGQIMVREEMEEKFKTLKDLLKKNLASTSEDASIITSMGAAPIAASAPQGVTASSSEPVNITANYRRHKDFSKVQDYKNYLRRTCFIGSKVRCCRGAVKGVSLGDVGTVTSIHLIQFSLLLVKWPNGHEKSISLECVELLR